jgi:hypothetical protein
MNTRIEQINNAIEEKQNLIKRIVLAKMKAEREGILDSVLENGLNHSIDIVESEIKELKRKTKQTAPMGLV